MRLVKLFPLVLVALTAFSCADEKKNVETELEIKTVSNKFEHKKSTIDAKFKDEKTATVFEEYINLKTALINTDATTASTQASNLMMAFVNIGVDEAALTAAKKIADTNDIEAQRSAFVGVTNAVEEMMQVALDGGTIYKQYCPMAFKNTGAYWLSESKEIANPFFGDKMYRCGRIDATIE